VTKRHLLLPVLLIVSALALAACGGGESDEAQIEDVVVTAATSTDPADCEALSTLAFMEQTEIEQGQAAVESCEEGAENTSDNPDEVTVTNVKVNGSDATADAAFVGGSFDGQTLTVALIQEDGDWKLNQVEDFAEFDKEKLLEAFRGQLVAEPNPLPESQADCMVSRLDGESDEEIQELLIGGEQAPLIALFESCV
jgi:hypothetical protein